MLKVLMASKASAKSALDKVLFLRDKNDISARRTQEIEHRTSHGSCEELDEYRCILSRHNWCKNKKDSAGKAVSQMG